MPDSRTELAEHLLGDIGGHLRADVENITGRAAWLPNSSSVMTAPSGRVDAHQIVGLEFRFAGERVSAFGLQVTNARRSLLPSSWAPRRAP